MRVTYGGRNQRPSNGDEMVKRQDDAFKWVYGEWRLLVLSRPGVFPLNLNQSGWHPVPLMCCGLEPGSHREGGAGAPLLPRVGTVGRIADGLSASVLSVLRVFMLKSFLTIVFDVYCILRNNTAHLILCIRDICTSLVRLCTVSIRRSAEVRRDS